MRIVRFVSPNGVRLDVWANDNVIDVTEAYRRSFQSFLDLVSEAEKTEKSIDRFLDELLKKGSNNLSSYPYKKIERGEGDFRLVIPIIPPEVWGLWGLHIEEAGKQENMRLA